MHVAVLMGGVSSEREVSLCSGRGVAEALEARGHRVSRIVVDDEEVRALADLRPDVAFVALHGRFGEDGGIQRRCAALGTPFTGSGIEASARAMDKAWSKRIFLAAGVPTPAWRLLPTPADPERAAAAIAESALGWPVVVKPVADGSSVGVSIVHAETGLAAALEKIEALKAAALIEAFVPGRELTVGILGEAALPPVELVPRREFYDYEAKYAAGSGTEYKVDPPLEPALRARVLEAAYGAHRALGCEGCSRVDVRLDPEGRPFVLEVNTIPGMTPRSLLPKAAAAAGISYGELCERLLEHAIARARRLGAAA